MHRIDTDDAVGSQFNDNPAVKSPTTRVPAVWLNDIQENVARVIEDAEVPLTKGRAEDLRDAIAAMIASAIASVRVPVGARVAYDRATPPSGWLAEDGAQHLRADYPDLVAFYVAQGRLIAGDTIAHFRVMDHRGFFPRGWDGGRGVDPGRVFGSEQDDAFESHDHSLPARSNADSGNGFVEDATGAETVRTATTGQTGDTETRPKNIATLFIIKF